MAQWFVKSADQIVFWLNQLMGFSFALFSSWNKGPYMPTKEATFGISFGPLLKVCGWLLVALNLVTINH